MHVYITLHSSKYFTSVISFDIFHSPMQRDIIMLFYRWETQGPESLNFLKNTTHISIISTITLFANAIKCYELLWQNCWETEVPVHQIQLTKWMTWHYENLVSIYSLRIKEDTSSNFREVIKKICNWLLENMQLTQVYRTRLNSASKKISLYKAGEKFLAASAQKAVT